VTTFGVEEVETRPLRKENRDVLKVRRRPNHVVQVGGWIFTSIHSRHSHIVRRVSPLPKLRAEALPETRQEAQWRSALSSEAKAPRGF
jgi:hypothetical protein